MPQQIDFGKELAQIDFAAELQAPAEKPQQAPAAKPKELGIGQWAARAIGGAFMGPAGVEAADNPGSTLLSAAIPVGLKHVPGLVARGLGISGARAAQNIQGATQAAKGAVVNTEKAGQAGLRAIDLQATGGRMPRVVQQFMQRVTTPGKGDLTFEEARDFYSNISRLSANEYNALNPTMQRQVGAMRQALHEALVESAETVGKGGQYAKGISEYARSARAAEAGRKVAKYGVGAAGLGVAGHYGLEKVIDALSRTSGSR
jgi:polyhydroxyalkanoate synthesis regulator phasin